VRRDPGIRPLEIERRFIMYVLMLTIVLPRVVFHGTVSDGAAILITWSALGILLTRRASYRIPHAIVWHPRDTRLRRWCAALLEQLGRVPIACGVRATPWDLRLLDAPRETPKQVDTPIARDLGEDLSASRTGAIP
jgi:hypothetical protein